MRDSESLLSATYTRQAVRTPGSGHESAQSGSLT